ncbi:MAG: SPOR domain-containing protein [Celeribacter sp.]|jgi:hypothetical protein
MTTGVFLRAISGATLLAVLAACEPGADAGSDVGAAVDRPAATRLVERDIEAPEVFQATEPGLWDGRPSLGGVWVAHPGVGDPERVIIRNESNGQFVIGALFKRERETAGPKIQVSADAANALGLLAGQPTALNVTALRREEKAQVEATAGSAAAPTAPVIGGETPAEGEVVIAAAPASTAAEAAPSSGRRWFWQKKTPAAPATATPAPAPASAASSVAAVGDAALAAPEAIRSTTLDPIAGAAAAIDAAEARGSNPAISAASAAPTTLASAPASAAPRASGSTLSKPFVQIGIFSVEGNAERSADALRGAGVVPTVYAQESSGTDFWRVVVGPATTTDDREAILAKVKAMGYADAYFVSR